MIDEAPQELWFVLIDCVLFRKQNNNFCRFAAMRRCWICRQLTRYRSSTRRLKFGFETLRFLLSIFQSARRATRVVRVRSFGSNAAECVLADRQCDARRAVSGAARARSLRRRRFESLLSRFALTNQKKRATMQGRCCTLRLCDRTNTPKYRRRFPKTFWTPTRRCVAFCRYCSSNTCRRCCAKRKSVAINARRAQSVSEFRDQETRTPVVVVVVG